MSNSSGQRTHDTGATARRWATWLLLGLLAAAVLLAHVPALGGFPGVDAGVYLYGGWRVLEGGLPYRDAWDHKPPAIFYVDALGLLIGGGEMWGVWLLELVALCLAAIFGFILLERAFGRLAAVFGSVAWLATLALVLGGGNRPEEFALPLQFAALLLCLEIARGDGSSRQSYLVGATGAMALLLKLNLIGVWLAILAYLALSRLRSGCRRSLLADLGRMALGAAVIIAPLLLYFAAQGALGSLWDAVVRFNLVYANRPLRQRLQVIYNGIQLTAQSGLSILALAAWLAGLAYAWRARRGVGHVSPLLHLSLLALPIELLLAAAAGGGFGHYYIPWLPTMAILAAFLAHSYAATSGAHFVATLGPLRIAATHLWLAALLAAMSFLPLAQTAGRLLSINNRQSQISHQIVDYIERHTSEEDYVLVWEGDPRINFMARRRSPSRFSYQYPLQLAGYESAAKAQEFLNDLMTNSPVLVLVASAGADVLDPAAFARQQKARRQAVSSGADGLLPEMEQAIDYIAANYALAAILGSGESRVFVYAAAD